MKINITLDEVEAIIENYIDTANTYADQLDDFDKVYIKCRVGYWTEVQKQLKKED